MEEQTPLKPEVQTPDPIVEMKAQYDRLAQEMQGKINILQGKLQWEVNAHKEAAERLAGYDGAKAQYEKNLAAAAAKLDVLQSDYDELKAKYDNMVKQLPPGKKVSVYVAKEGDNKCPPVAPAKGQECPVCHWIYGESREPHSVAFSK
jgi:hypothetical protein